MRIKPSISDRVGQFENEIKQGPYFVYATGVFKGTLSGLRQFSATESPLKMMKNTFCFTSKALFVLKIFKFLC